MLGAGASDLLMQLGSGDPLGLLSPVALAHRHRPGARRPGSGPSSIKPGALLGEPGASSAGGAAAGQQAQQVQQASSMLTRDRRSDMGDNHSFLRSPHTSSSPRMPAPFKPAEQQHSVPALTPQHRGGSLLPSPGGFGPLGSRAPVASSAARSGSRPWAPGASSEGGPGRNLILVQPERLETLDAYLSQVRPASCFGFHGMWAWQYLRPA